MKKTKYKLPGLLDVPAAPKNITKTTPLRDSGVSKIAGFNGRKTTPITLGRAPHSALKSSQSGSQWSKLLTSTASGGLANTLGSAAGLGGGIGSIISGISSLFGGGKNTPPALVEYQLPTSQQQAVSIGGSPSNTGIYAGPGPTAPFESQSTLIIQSVKQALLNSSSLNDIISEI